jgi:hypothetical protein
MFENWVGGGMFGPQRDEGVGTGADCTTRSFALFSLQKLLSRLKYREDEKPGTRSIHGHIRNAYKVLVLKS